MRDTCTSIADELIFGKEIAKSVKCLKNTHTKKNKRFGFTSLLHCEKKTVVHSTSQYQRQYQLQKHLCLYRLRNQNNCFSFFSSADTSHMGEPVGMNNPLLITSHGTVRWLAPIILKSSCKLSVRYFPFDEQFCRLKFASWTYSNSSLRLVSEETEILQNYTGKLHTQN